VIDSGSNQHQRLHVSQVTDRRHDVIYDITSWLTDIKDVGVNN